MRLSTIEMMQITGGRWIHRPVSDLAITGISTDTRTIQTGDCFVALKGENFDGHDYLKQALEKGAASLVIERDHTEQAQSFGIPTLSVVDTTEALGDLARVWRRKCMTQRVAVVGSSGKTTTKDMLATILSDSDPTHSTDGNLNNLIGVPKTIFDMRQDHRYLVLEMGMNQAGELSRLTEIARPDLLLLLNIGNAHVGQFGSVEALRRVKAEAVEGLEDEAVIVYDADSEGSREIVARFGGDRMKVSFGIDNEADVMAKAIKPHHNGGYTFALVMGHENILVRIPVFGRYNVRNAVAAAAAAHALGINSETIARGLSKVQPAAMRSEIRRVGQWDILVDCYNANPDSMHAAMDSAGEWMQSRKESGRLFMVLGQMLELGDTSEAAHKNLASHVSELKPYFVALVGEAAMVTRDKLKALGIQSNWYADAQGVADDLLDMLQPEDVVFLKGSRGNKLETVVAYIENSISTDRHAKAKVKDGK